MLRVAIIGYNAPCSIRAMYELVRACEDDYPIDIKDRRVVMKSGTIFEAIIGSECNRARYEGVRYDQLIIVDDPRKTVLRARAGIIEEITTLIKWRSCVPEEFIIQFYEW